MSKLKISPKPYATMYVLFGLTSIVLGLIATFIPMLTFDSGIGEKISISFFDSLANVKNFKTPFILAGIPDSSLTILRVYAIIRIFIYVPTLISLIYTLINSQKCPDFEKATRKSISLGNPIMDIIIPVIEVIFINFMFQKNTGADISPASTILFIVPIIQLVFYFIGFGFHIHYNKALKGEVEPFGAAKYPPEVIEEQPKENTESEDDVINAISKYKALYDNGTITKEEFEAKKAELLKK